MTLATMWRRYEGFRMVVQHAGINDSPYSSHFVCCGYTGRILMEDTGFVLFCLGIALMLAVMIADTGRQDK